MTPNDERADKLVINRALLKAFMNGQLDSAVELQVADYLERHPQLLEQAAAVSGDGFLQRVKDVKQQSVFGTKPLVKAAVVSPHISEASSVMNIAKPLGRIASADNADAPELTKSVDVIKEAKKRAQALVLPDELASYSAYQVHKELGRGGMGVVYLARNVQMDRLEVLKVLNERLLDHAGAKERFLREIQAVSKLSHPNIVTSYTVLSLGKLSVFVMEYVHGQNLYEFILKNKALPIALACSFTRQLAAGLKHAHDRGLVHRDIKPSNAMVFKSDGQLQLKILDFGLAKATSEKSTSGLTHDGMMLGTPEYMAPEQMLNAAKADIRADVYSLGCTLYHMLIGRAPFVGTQGEVMMAHSQREPKALYLLRPEVPIELAAVVAKMMAKQPEKRYQVPSEVMVALEPFLGKSSKIGGQALSGSGSNTVTDLASPSRDTSVEEPAPDMSLTPKNQVLSPTVHRQEIASVMTAQRPRGIQSVRPRRQTHPPSFIKRHWPALVPTVLTLLFGYYFLGGFFSNRKPEGLSFVSLFNGRDFTGWKYDAEVAKTWTITNGELVGSGTHAGLETIRSDYRNFEIDAEISLRSVNSGLIFGGENGFECELCIPTSDHMPALGAILLNGDTAGRLSPRVLKRVRAQPDTWLRLRLRCEKERISVVIDNEQVVDGSVGAPISSGPIRFEQWLSPGSIAIRKLVIRELP